MTTNYFWDVEGVDCYPEHKGLRDVVFTVHWRRKATSTDGHIADIYGSQAVTLDPNAAFTPYEQLTKAIVEEWLVKTMGPDRVAALNAALNDKLEKQINPPVISPPLPWA